MSRSKKNLLAGASAAVFALAIGGSAMATGADVVIPDISGSGAGVAGNTAINDSQNNTTGVTAAAVIGPNSHTITVTGTGNANTLTNNIIGAIAAGNTADDAAPLNAIGPGPVTGIGILNLASNVDHLATAIAGGSLVAATLTDFVDGTATVTGNTIESSTTLNTATISVTPSGIPLFFAAGSPGKNTFQVPSTPLLHAEGDVAAVNAQENFDSGSGSGSFALTAGAAVTLAIGQDTASTGDHAVSAASTLSGNSITSTFAGNNSATAIGAGAGGQPTFAGSLTLDNVQYNLDLATDDISALTEGVVIATISGDATGTGSLATETLASTLIETGNTISSSASGNSALATTGAGNSISVANGVSFVDPDGQTHENNVDIGFGIAVNTAAGLTLFNGQFNDRDTDAGQVPLVALTGGAVIAQVENANGGAVTLTTDSVTSAASGNTATNAITAGGANSAVIDGTAALTSVQQNTHSAIVAEVGGGAVLAGVGVDAGSSTVTNSTATVSNNTVGATAYGDSVGNTVSLAGQTIASGAVSGTITRLTADQRSVGPGYSADSDGSTLVSVQRISGSGSEVIAENIAALAELDAGFDTAVTGDTLSVDGNFLQAISVGNSAGSSIGSTIGASGGSFAGTLGLLSGQTDSAAVTANLTDAAANLIVTAGGGDVGEAGAGTALSLSGNVLRALAYDNQVTGNDLAVAVTSLSVEGVTSKGSEIVVSTADASGLVFDNFSRPAPLVIAGLALLNDQSTTAGAADVTANNTSEDNAVLLTVGNGDDGGDLVASTAVANANAVVSAARGNVAANGTTITTQSLSVAPTGFDPVASVTNIQTMIVGSDARAITDTSNTGDPETATAALPTVELAIGGSVLGSTASANTNQVSAVAEGNTATNTLNVTSGSLTAAWVSIFPLYITGAQYTGVLTNDAAFTVTNAQSSMLDSRGATVVDDGVSVDIGDSVSTGTVRADTNQLFAQASDNTATNTLSIASSSFEASASVQSLQLSNTAALFVNQGSAGTGVAVTVGGDVSGSTLDASGNTYSATGTNNTATNQVTVAAGYATGAIGPVPQSHQGAFYTAPIYSTATGDLTLQNVQSQSGDTSANSNAVTSINVTDPADRGGVDAVQASVLTASNNQNQATAQGNQATNGISLSVTNSTGETAALVSDQDSTASTMFTTATSSVLADQLVASSTVTQSGNVNLAQSGLNNVTNALLAGGSGASLGAGYGDAGAGAALVGAGYGVEADFALANVQTALGDARLDAAGTFTVGNSDVASSVFGASGTVSNSTVTLAGNSNGAQSTVNRAVNTLTLNPGASIGANGGAQNLQILGTPFVTAETSTAYSVTEPNFNNSAISVTGNGSTAQALGNVATNTVSVSAVNATLASPLFLEQGAAAFGYNQAIADYALGNAQISDGEFGSSNEVLFSVATTVPTEDVNVLTAGSAIHVSGNSAQAAAEANFATNVLTLAVTDAVNGDGAHAATAALYSLQEHTGSAASESTETIEAIGMVTESTVDMSDNTNLALSVGNDVSNLIEAAASADFEAAANSWVTDSAQANGITTGDIALSNYQQGNSATTAVANTTIEQSDSLPLTGTTTVRDSTVAVNGNTTFAEADQNRATNTATLNAGAVNGGFAAVSNTQNSSGSVTADVTASISYSEPNATAASVSMNGNSTIAQATGNSANNALNASAGAQFVISGAPAQTNTNGDTSGQFAVLNTQNNSASISASNTTVMTVALNGPAFAGVVSNSGLSAQNNTISAIATANAATNSITLAGGVTGTSPAALSNFQQNSGSVTATITGSSISVTAGNPGGIYGSNLTVANNSIIARATGNSATNIIAVK